MIFANKNMKDSSISDCPQDGLSIPATLSAQGSWVSLYPEGCRTFREGGLWTLQTQLLASAKPGPGLSRKPCTQPTGWLDWHYPTSGSHFPWLLAARGYTTLFFLICLQDGVGFLLGTEFPGFEQTEKENAT